MFKSRFYLDCRAVAPGALAPLRIFINVKNGRAIIPTGISLLPTHWDAAKRSVIVHPHRRQINETLAGRKAELDALLYRLEAAGELRGLTATEVQRKVRDSLFPLAKGATTSKPKLCFIDRFDRFAEDHTPGTRRVYAATRSRLLAYLGEEKLSVLTFEEINYSWLKDFDKFLAKTSPSRNARNIHFRNIRAVFNDAITEELITCYPFRKFKTTPEKTRKRALTVEQLRALWTLEVEPWQQRYLDCFKLIFLLCGINIVDLCGLKDLTNGRADYRRAKTHRLYSIKAEPETLALIELYKGEKQLLSYLDTCDDYRSYYTRFNTALHDIGKKIGVTGLSSYWARHSWATVAAALDIPKETIAAALGHGGWSVTDIYIDFDQRKVDAANRKVIDWVLYGSR